jgi:hypothetical protein
MKRMDHESLPQYELLREQRRALANELVVVTDGMHAAADRLAAFPEHKFSADPDGNRTEHSAAYERSRTE